jgi:hypothetical protein
MQMSITRANCLSVCLRDRDGRVTLCVLSPQMLACHALRGTKCLLEHVNYDVLARIGIILLKKLRGTTRQTQSVRCSGNGMAITLTFSNMFNLLTVPTRADANHCCVCIHKFTCDLLFCRALMSPRTHFPHSTKHITALIAGLEPEVLWKRMSSGKGFTRQAL